MAAMTDLTIRAFEAMCLKRTWSTSSGASRPRSQERSGGPRAAGSRSPTPTSPTSMKWTGGHFAAWEEPELFATEIRAAFKSLR